MTYKNFTTSNGFHTIALVRKTVVTLRDLCCGNGQPARNELLEALSRDGCCFVESDDSSRVRQTVLSECSSFFGSASHQERSQLTVYPCGLLRGYFPPLEANSRRLERRKERLVFGDKNNLFPGSCPLLRAAYSDFYTNHIKRIADVVHSSVYEYIREIDAYWAANFQRFFLDPSSGELEPSVLAYAMHYPPLEDPEEFLDSDDTVTISEPHVDMTTFTILPRGTSGATKMFDTSGKAVPIYDSSIPPDAIVVFLGKTLERLLEDIPFQNKDARYPFKALKHTVRIAPEEVVKGRDVVGYFFNGNVERRYLTVASAEEFGSMFIDRRPVRLKQLEPLSGAELTVNDRQYLTEQLFFSDASPNSASPPVTLQQFRSVNQAVQRGGLSALSSGRAPSTPRSSSGRW